MHLQSTRLPAHSPKERDPTMTQSPPPHRVCPTRIDRRPALVIHKVTTSQCRDRQRGQYHKCYTCAYNHAFVAKYGEPQVKKGKVEPANLPKLLEVPVEGVAEGVAGEETVEQVVDQAEGGDAPSAPVPAAKAAS